jgi:hypothetical protein
MAQETVEPESVKETPPGGVEPLPSGSFPALPAVIPAPISGFEDEAAYLRSIADRVQVLAGQADVVADATRRVDLLAAAANLTLAHELESCCTKRLLHLRGRDPGMDEATCRAGLDRADALIERASSSVQALRDSEEELPESWLVESSRRLETLRAFASAFRVYLVAGSDEEDSPDLRRAASLLAPLREDPNRRVAAAARLWQACLRARAGSPTRALSILEPALIDPPADSMPYALFARLLRCRLVAEIGGSAGALALLMQVEDRSTDWLSSQEERDQAARAAQFLRLQIMADWYARLDETRQSDERNWCIERSGRLIEERFSDGGNSVLRLTPVIPVFARPPEPEPVKDRARPAEGD